MTDLLKVLGPLGRMEGRDSTPPWLLRSMDDESRYLYIEPGGDSLLLDSPAEDLERLVTFDRGLQSLVISYLDQSFADAALREITRAWPVVIDDDRGNMVLGEEFTRLVDMGDQ